MAADGESFSLLGRVAGALAVVAAPITWLWTQLAKKADKEDLKHALGHIEKLYSNAETDRKLTRDLHDKAMERIQENQTQLIDILSRR